LDVTSGLSLGDHARNSGGPINYERGNTELENTWGVRGEMPAEGEKL